MTKLKYWYLTQSDAEKRKFRLYIIDACGISPETFWRYLEVTQAPKLTRHLISDYTKIPNDELYKQLEIKQP